MIIGWLKRLFGTKQFDFVETESEPGVVFECSMPVDPKARSGPQGLSETYSEEPSVCFHMDFETGRTVTAPETLKSASHRDEG